VLLLIHGPGVLSVRHPIPQTVCSLAAEWKSAQGGARVAAFTGPGRDASLGR
jgi:hypothetical protein